MSVLPPGVSAEAFGSAIKEYQAVVGPDWVFTSDEDIFPYRDPFSFVKGEPEELIPSAVVAPSSVEQVQAVVRIANKYKTPLFPVSTGKNYGYGGASPNLRGSIVVDLKRMNRVLEVNEDRHYALVEPGVAYFDLYRYIQERGLKVMLDPPDPGWGSPMGNALDRGSGYTMGNYRDHSDAHIGLEVVLANGEVMRTGTGAIANSKTWQDHKWAFGPDPAGLFFQGNFGIVTKMGVRLMPQPEHFRTGMLTVPKRMDFIPLVKLVSYMTDLQMLGSIWYGSPLRRLMQNAEFKAAVNKPEINPDELDRMAAAANLPSWSVELNFYGSEKTTAANWDYAKELLAKYVPDGRAIDGEHFPLPPTKEQYEKGSQPYASTLRRNVVFGKPGLGIWWTESRTIESPNEYNQTHFGLMSILPRSGEGVFEFQKATGEIARELGVESGISALSTPSTQQQYSFKMASRWGAGLEQTPEDRKKQLAIIKKVLAMNAKHGWGDYRAPPVLQDAVSAQYDFNDHAMRRFHETMKDAVDPNGILAPGRGGIWPAPFRSHREQI